MERVKTFLKRKNIQISARRYGIDALGAMAQGLFCSLLIGTILDTLGDQLANSRSWPNWSKDESFRAVRDASADQRK